MRNDVEALFRTHQQRIYRYLCRVVGHGDTARDLTQEVFVKVAGGRMPALAEGEQLPWMYRVARNLAVDHLRTAGRQSTGPLPEVARPATQDVSVDVRQALNTLTDLDRHIFCLREVAGLGYAAIAASCDLTPDAVRSRIHRSRLHLREQLAAPINLRQHKPVALRRWPQGDQ